MKEQWVKVGKAVGICFCICLLIALAMVGLIRMPLLSGMKAYMYRLLILEGICCVVLFAAELVIALKGKTVFGMDFFSMVMCITASAIFMALFFCLGPTTIDRAYTVFILSDMADNADTVYSAQDIKDKFIQGYIEEADESKRRAEEQLSVGNIETVEGGYRISEKGERLIRLFRFIEKIYPVQDKNSIYPNGEIG